MPEAVGMDTPKAAALGYCIKAGENRGLRTEKGSKNAI
jgi:hypothetical protein